MPTRSSPKPTRRTSEALSGHGGGLLLEGVTGLGDERVERGGELAVAACGGFVLAYEVELHGNDVGQGGRKWSEPDPQWGSFSVTSRVTRPECRGMEVSVKRVTDFTSCNGTDTRAPCT